MPIVPIAQVRGKRILYVATEDWFFRSHILPMARAAVQAGFDVTLAARLSAAASVLASEGIRVVSIGLARASLNPFSVFREVAALRRLLRTEQPDILHLVALKPILVGGFAALFCRRRPVVNHVLGVGFLGVVRAKKRALARRLIWPVLRAFLAAEQSWVLVENEDDARDLGRFCRNPITKVGGSGIDPQHFAELPPPNGIAVTAAVVSRMLWSKGIDTAVEAQQLLWQRGVHVNLTLAGSVESDLPNALSEKVLKEWSALPGIRWIGHQMDVRTVWRGADIALLSSRGGEGIPRAIVEAAACGRPVITTDVAGCRDFIRSNVEGLVIPPDEPLALAQAIELLALNPELRRRMGRAARARVLSGYTEMDVTGRVVQLYDLISLRQRRSARADCRSRKRAMSVVEGGIDRFARSVDNCEIRAGDPDMLLQHFANCLAKELVEQHSGCEHCGKLIGLIAAYSWRYLWENIETGDPLFGLGSRVELMQWNMLLERTLMNQKTPALTAEAIATH